MSRSRSPGRVRRRHRPERRRQDVALQPALGAPPADARAGSGSTGRTSPTRPPYRRTRLGLGRTFQVSNVFPLLPVRENVRLAAQARLGGTLRLWRRANAVAEAVEKARLGARAGRARRAVGVGGGIALARRQAAARARDGARRRPAVILLDEPMAGVSVENVPRARRADPHGSRRGEEDRADGRAPHRGRHRPRRPDRRHAPRPPARVRHAGGDHAERDGAGGVRRGGAL